MQKLLSLSPMPQATLSYHELRGFLYGIAITPDNIQPDEWLPLVFNEKLPSFADEHQARELTGTLYAVLNKHIAAFHSNALFLPFDMDNLKRSDFEKIFDWTSGFEEALSLRPDCWEEREGLNDEERDHLMNSLLIIEGLVYPEDAIDMFDHLPAEELGQLGLDLSGSDMEKIAQIQFFMLQALELSVETIQAHAATLERKRRKEMRSSSAPFRRRSSRIGASAPCPCGSGRTFAACCALPLPGKRGGQGRKGQLIKVEFDRRGRNAPSRKNEDRDSGGLGYQLHIGLMGQAPVWRRLRIPAAMSLAALHRCLRLIMGWRDGRDHCFTAGARRFGGTAGAGTLAEGRYSLHDVEKELRQGLRYVHDAAATREIVIVLEQTVAPADSVPYPLLVDGAGMWPPEEAADLERSREAVSSPDVKSDERRTAAKPADIRAVNEQLRRIDG